MRKLLKQGCHTGPVALSVAPCFGQFRDYYNIVAQIQPLISINFNNFCADWDIERGAAADRGFEPAGSGDEILDIQVDEARQSGPLEFLDPQQAGIYVRQAGTYIRDVFCSA